MAVSKVVVVDGNNLIVRIDRGVAGRSVTDVQPVEINNALYLEFFFSDGTTQTVGPVGTIQYLGQSPIVVSGSTISLSTVPVTLGGTGQTTANAGFNALAPAQTGNSGKYLKTDGTNSAWDLIDISTADITGVLPIANGGTGQSTQAAAITALAGTQSAGKYLRSDGTNTSLASIQAADVPTLNQNTTGTAANITATSNSTLTTLSVLSLPGSQITGNISGNAANVTGTVAIANGGTGQTTANAAFNALVPAQTGNSGKFLTTDGSNTSWSVNPLGTVTSVDVSGGTTGLTTSGGPVTTSGTITLAGTLGVANGGTGATTLTGYVYGNGTGAFTASTTIPTSALTGNFVSTFSGGTTGLLPSSATAGAVTLSGTLAVANGGTGVTSSSGANSVVLRDTNQNVFANNFIPNTTTITSSSTPINLTIASAQYQIVNGSTQSQQFNLPDATTLTIGETYYFNNNITYSSVQINAHDGTTSILALQAGGAAHVILLSNSTTNGTWDVHSYVPASASWGNATLSFNSASSISGSVTWSGNAVGIAYGGTGQTTANAAFNALAPSQTGNSGKFLTTDGTNTSWSTNPLGTVTSVAATVPSFLSISGSPITTSGTLAITLSGTALPTTSGGTGLTSFTAGDLPYYASGTALSKLGIGTSGQILTSSGTAPQWSTLSGVAVTTFSAGTTGFTPSSATSGAITLAGTLATTNGGTGLTSFTANQVFYASSTSAFAQSTNLQFSGTDLTVYGITVGRGAGAVSTNTAVGASALTTNSTGSGTSAFGDRALAANTSGTNNAAFGQLSLYGNTAGGTNSAFGHGTLFTNTTGSSNTAVGDTALFGNTTASNNTAVGYQAGYSNTTGTQNVYMGVYAGQVGTTSSYNIALGFGALNQNTGSNNAASGYYALASNSSGAYNTAHGSQALYANTTASNNTAVGYQAGYSNTTGAGLTFVGNGTGFANTTGTDNVAVGSGYSNGFTFYTNTTGSFNSAFGGAALKLNTTGSYNTAIGQSALLSNTTASNNTAVGYQAGYSNTTGTAINAFGYQALYANTTGIANSAFGGLHTGNVDAALRANTTGNYNNAFGSGALSANTTGSQNTSVGYASLAQNTTGSNNIALGHNALYNNTTASNGTAVGLQALYSNTTAGNNTAVGYQAGFWQTGGSNTALGFSALNGNTSGGTGGINNVAVGSQTMLNSTTGGSNTAVGTQALQSNTTASNNTAVGYQAGYAQTTADGNALVGYQSGYSLTTGNLNSFFGAAAGGAITTGTKNSILGRYNGNQGGLDIRTASNYIVLSDGDGNPRAYQSSTGGWYQYNNSTLWSITSDIRIKKNVVSLESGLSIIQALRPVEFDYIENDKHDIGFIAQEYQTVLPKQVNVKDDGMLSLSPNLVPYLVKAVQELKAEFDAYKATHP